MKRYGCYVMIAVILAGCSVHSKPLAKPSPPARDVAYDGPKETRPPSSQADSKAPPLPVVDTVECANRLDGPGNTLQLMDASEVPHGGSDISFERSGHGWLAQKSPQLPSAAVYETSDFGKTWNKRVAISHGFIADMRWAGAVGIISAIDTSSSLNPVRILVTTRDRGHTWFASACEVAITSVTATAFTGKYRGEMYISTNGGGRWERVPGPKGHEGVQLLPLNGDSDLAGLFSSGAGNQLFMTKDNGVSWTPVSAVQNPIEMSSGPDQSLWVVNLEGLWVSRDNGATWSLSRFPEHPDIQDASLRVLDLSKAAIKVTDRPVFLTVDTTDDGWQTLTLPVDAHMEGSYGFAFSGSDWYVLGDWMLNHRSGFSLWRSEDAGRSWVKMTSLGTP